MTEANEAAKPNGETVRYGGRTYAKFIRHPKRVSDGSVRCVACGQIDEPEVHDNALCPMTQSATPTITQVSQDVEPAADRLHPSHKTRSSDASSFDEVCVNCHATDVSGGGWGKLAEPCPHAISQDVPAPAAGVREAALEAEVERLRAFVIYAAECSDDTHISGKAFAALNPTGAA